MSSYIFTFENDVNVSLVEKAAVLKMLRTILHNLADPSKAQDIKYRQLRLSNSKIQSITRHSIILSFLQHIVGFQKVMEGDEHFLRIPQAPTEASVASATTQVAAAYDRISTRQPITSIAATAAATNGKLSEKQKARRLAEERARKEKEEARLARKRTAAQIKTDKYVRENDPNWKPAVNAAAAKTGDSISTFRDKYGEN